MRLRATTTSLLAAVLMLSACGAGDDGDTATSDPGEVTTGEDAAAGGGAAGACLEGTEDCVDADLGGGGGAPPPDDAPVDPEQARADARSLLGEPEDEVLATWDDVRLGRSGDEEFLLTDDLRPGRKTIATEDDGTGTYRVVEVTLELDDGPETFTAEE